MLILNRRKEWSHGGLADLIHPFSWSMFAIARRMLAATHRTRLFTVFRLSRRKLTSACKDAGTWRRLG